MAKFFVTFGQKYAREPHPTCPRVHPDGFVMIEADNYDSARQTAFKHFGHAWSDLLPETKFDDSYYPSGMLETIAADQTVEESA